MLFEGIADCIKFASPAERDFAMLWVLTYPNIDLDYDYRFCDRRWRLDFVHHPSKVAIELDGFEAHTSYPNFERDRFKDLAAQGLGYRVIRITTSMSKQIEVLHDIAHIIQRTQAETSRSEVSALSDSGGKQSD